MKHEPKLTYVKEFECGEDISQEFDDQDFELEDWDGAFEVIKKAGGGNFSVDVTDYLKFLGQYTEGDLEFYDVLNEELDRARPIGFEDMRIDPEDFEDLDDDGQSLKKAAEKIVKSCQELGAFHVVVGDTGNEITISLLPKDVRPQPKG